MLLDTSGFLCLHHQPEMFHLEACQATRALCVCVFTIFCRTDLRSVSYTQIVEQWVAGLSVT